MYRDELRSTLAVRAARTIRDTHPRTSHNTTSVLEILQRFSIDHNGDTHQQARVRGVFNVIRRNFQRYESYPSLITVLLICALLYRQENPLTFTLFESGLRTGTGGFISVTISIESRSSNQSSYERVATFALDVHKDQGLASASRSER